MGQRPPTVREESDYSRKGRAFKAAAVYQAFAALVGIALPALIRIARVIAKPVHADDPPAAVFLQIARRADLKAS